MLAFVCYLIVAAVCALIAERIAPGGIPGGFIVAAVVGVIGAWIGASLFGNFGPTLAGISLLPAILGSALLVFGLSLCGKGFGRR